MKREKLMKLLTSKFKGLSLRTTEEFNGGKDGIWVAGTEDGLKGKNGKLLFDYYTQDIRETNYQFGINREFVAILHENGWYGEWHDAGTLMLYPS